MTGPSLIFIGKIASTLERDSLEERNFLRDTFDSFRKASAYRVVAGFAVRKRGYRQSLSLVL